MSKRNEVIAAMSHAISFTPMWDEDTIGDNLTREEITAAASSALDAALSALETPSDEIKAAAIANGPMYDDFLSDAIPDMWEAMLNTLKAPA